MFVKKRANRMDSKKGESGHVVPEQVNADRRPFHVVAIFRPCSSTLACRCRASRPASDCRVVLGLPALLGTPGGPLTVPFPLAILERLPWDMPRLIPVPPETVEEC